MTVDKRDLKKKDDEGHSKLASLMGVFRHKKEEEPPETVDLSDQKKRRQRVVRPGPMAMKHGSEAYKPHQVTEDDIRITEEVMEGLTPGAQAPAPQAEAESTFACLQCGARVPQTSERCPKCHALYIKDLTEEELRLVEEAEEDGMQLSEEAGEFLNKEGVPCIHFDAETGTVSYLEEDDSDPDFVLECSHCGTGIEFDTDRCPICGTKLDISDSGIVGLFSDMKFDEESSKEMDCPLCGEHVTLINGRCPECKEAVRGWDSESSDKVEPVIHTDNVIFLHLDVESGELNYLQKLARKLGYEQLKVHLDGIGGGGFEQDWKSLSRI